MKIKKLSLFLMCAAVAMSVAAAQPQVIDLWPAGAPNSNGIDPSNEVITSNSARNVVHPQLTVYHPEHPNGMAIVACPGGSYAYVSMENEGRSMGQWMMNQGVTFCVLQYRMPGAGHHEVPLSDLREAFKIVADSAEVWHVNRSEIGVMGASAGGHLAASSAVLAGEDGAFRPAFQILLYPVITMKDGTHVNSRRNLIGDDPAQEIVERYTLENHVTADTPPAFIATTADDSVVSVEHNTLPYVMALAANKVPYSLHVYPHGRHGFGYNEQFAGKRQWTGELEVWLRSLRLSL